MKTLSIRRVAAGIPGWNTPAIDHSAWLRTGIELESGGIYVDLAAPRGVPFVALPGQVAGSGNRYVARRDVAVGWWNRLVESSVADRPGQCHLDIRPVGGVGIV